LDVVGVGRLDEALMHDRTDLGAGVGGVDLVEALRVSPRFAFRVAERAPEIEEHTWRKAPLHVAGERYDDRLVDGGPPLDARAPSFGDAPTEGAERICEIGALEGLRLARRARIGEVVGYCEVKQRDHRRHPRSVELLEERLVRR